MIGQDGGVVSNTHVSPNPCHMTTGKNSWLSVVTEGDARGIWTTAAEQVLRTTAMERLQRAVILLRIMEMIILLYSVRCKPYKNRMWTGLGLLRENLTTWEPGLGLT